MKTKYYIYYAIAMAMMGGLAGNASASVLYMNSAGSDMASFNPADGSLVTTYTQNKGNGRGIVTVGDTLYYTVASSGNVYKRSVSTNVDQGVAFAVAGASGLQAISYDGTNFWVGDYSGTTKAYYVNGTTGALINTITLDGTITHIEGYYDGLEYFNGKLIANRYDGGYARAGGNQYDIYDLSGHLLTAAFINTNGHGNGTGIAFDGTDFYVSDIFNGNNEISMWSGVDGHFIKTINLAGSHGAIEDLSFDFAGRSDTCGGPNQPPCTGGEVTEPISLLLLGIGLAGVTGVSAMRRKQRA